MTHDWDEDADVPPQRGLSFTIKLVLFLVLSTSGLALLFSSSIFQ